MTIRWTEPIQIKRSRELPEGTKSLKLGRSFISWSTFTAIICVAALMVRQWLKLPPVKNYWLGLLFSAISGGAVLGVLKPWLFSYLESQVVVSDAGVNRNCYNGFLPTLKVEFWPWHEILRTSIQQRFESGQSITLLILHGHDGGELASIGVADDVSIMKLSEVIAAKLEPQQSVR